MANQQQLRKQIEEETAFDKKINKYIDNFLKQHRQFYQAQERQGYDLVLIVNELCPSQIRILSKEDYYDREDYRESKFKFFFKYKNKHNTKSHINTFIDERNPFKKGIWVKPE